jgi:histidinol-phosphate aminotransferase
VVNPNNPTGVAVPPATLAELAETCLEAGTILVIDEAYVHFYGMSAMGLLERFPNLVVLRTFSKLCAMAALRLGFAAASPRILADLRRVKPTYDVNGLAVRMASALLEKPEIMESLVANASAGRDHLCEALTAARIEHRAGRANFVLIRLPGRAEAVAQELALRGVLVAHGFTQPLLAHTIRVNIGAVPIMERFLEAFWPALEATADPTQDRDAA